MNLPIFAAALLGALSLGLSQMTMADTVLKLGHVLSKDSHYGTAASVFGAELAKRTNGRYKVEQFPSGALGGEREMVEAVKQGMQDMVLTSTGPVGNFVPEARIVDIPFLFRDYAHARAVLDGPIGQDLLKKFPAKGLVAVAWMENGFRQMTNNKHAISQPEDLHGLKIRTMENQAHMAAFKAMGAQPAPMPMPEVYAALQQGKVDGQENPIPVILSSKIYQVQKNLTLTNHVYSPALLLVSPKVWDALSDADKAAFHEAARVAVAANRKRVNDDEAKGIAQIKAAGVNVVEKVDNAAFLKAASLAYTGYMAEFGVDNIKRIQNYK